MKHLILATVVTFGMMGAAQAGELDDEGSVINSGAMDSAIIVRVDKRTNKASVMQAKSRIKSNDEAKALAKKGKFKSIPAKHLSSELDKDRSGGSSSWYFNNNCGYGGWGNGYGCGNYGGYGQYYSNMYWYGQYYNPCYSYNYGGYQYYYYSNYYGGGYGNGCGYGGCNGGYPGNGGGGYPGNGGGYPGNGPGAW